MNEKHVIPDDEGQVKTVEFSSCPLIEDKTRDEVEEEGWEYDYSWHQKIWEQVEDVAERVKRGQETGDWEYIRVAGFTDEEKKDTVTYLFKRKTPQRLEWDEKQGYN